MIFFKKNYKHNFIDPQYAPSGICVIRNHDLLRMKGNMIYTCSKCGKKITLSPMEILNVAKKQLYGCVR